MAINTEVLTTETKQQPAFPMLRQHTTTRRVYLFTAPMQAVLLAHGPDGPIHSGDTLGENAHTTAPCTDEVYTKCSITLASKD